MSVEGNNYGRMLENSHLDGSEDFWIKEVLEEATDIYGERKGLNTGLHEVESLSEGYTGYVLENRGVDQKILGFEVAPVISEAHGTGFSVRPEEDGEEYDDFKDAIFKAIYRDVEGF